MFHTYYVIFSDMFALFLAQNFINKVLTAKKSTFRMSVDTKYPPYEGRDLLELPPSQLHFIPIVYIPMLIKTANL